MSSPVWTRFSPPSGADLTLLPVDVQVKSYRIDAVCQIRGSSPLGLRAGDTLVRAESPTQLPPGPGSLAGVTQHVLYTTAVERSELLAASASESGPVAVLIPIAKSPEWWGLAQDQRDAIFRGRERSGAQPAGHLALGRVHAARVYRKLYHARCLPGAQWDFLTYFEFPAQAREEFHALLTSLRNESINPEWAYVARECEIWMSVI